ncbi:MAG: hypothetical protein IPI78_06975 [Chitinophagaceae bacterium]|nr:hypothetical protein [Chitinophagaceae bacterium]
MQKFCNIIFSVFLFVSFSATAQHKVSKHASQLQLEVFGEGGLFSLNYDARFAKKENGIGFSLGLGGTPLGLGGYSCNSGFQLSLPIGLNYLAGKINIYLKWVQALFLYLFQVQKFFVLRRLIKNIFLVIIPKAMVIYLQDTGISQSIKN